MMLTLLGFVFAFCPFVHALSYAEWSAKPAWPEPISLAAGTAATLTTLALRHPLVQNFEHYEITHRPLGHWSKWGDLAGQDVPNVVYTGAMLIGSWAGHKRDLAHAEFMITATLEAALIVEGVKLIVREERPDSHQRTSFPSGHSATAFAFAAVVGQEHGWRWGLPAYALAGFVGWSRVNDHRHFLHDTLAGATIGLSTALGIYLKRDPIIVAGSTLSFSPIPLADGGAIGVSTTY